MTYIRRHVIDVTTDETSAASTFSADPINGLIHSILYEPGAGGSSFPNTTDITITSELSSAAVLTAANVAAGAHYYPRQATHMSTAGGTTNSGFDLVALADERLKVVIAQGGDAKTGRFHVYVR
jgi:hypothetical protein